MTRSELSTIWRHSRIYSIANILSRMAGLVLLPIYLHVLSPAEFGVLALVSLSTDVLGVILGLGLGRALLRFYVGATSDEERDHLVVGSLVLLLGLGLAFSLAAHPVARLVCWLIFSDPEHVELFTYANLAIVFTVLFNFELSCLLARKASLTYLCAALSKTVILFGANITLVVYLDMGVMGVVLGTLLSSVLISGLLLLELLRGRRMATSASAIRRLVAFAAPLVPSVLLDTIVAALDKLALGRLGSSSAVGEYATSQRLSGLLQMFVTQPFMQIWVVRRIESLDAGSAEDGTNLGRIFSLFLVLLCACALFLALFAPEVISVIASEEYRNAASIIPTLALAQVLLAFRSYFEVGVFHANATRHLPWIALVTLVFAVPTYAGLVTLMGTDGAALAFLIVTSARVSLVGALASRISPLVQDLPALACLAAAAGAVLAYAAAGLLAPADGGWVAGSMKLAVVLAYFAIMFFSPAIDPDLRRAILQGIAKRFAGPRSTGGAKRP